MDNITFGRYINNHSFLTKIDARIKIAVMILLLISCFLNFNIIGFGLLFLLLCLLMTIGKLSFKPLVKIVRHMWLLFLMLLIINLLTIKGEVLFQIMNVYIYKEALFETIYIFFRIVMLLMISNLLSSSTTSSDLTYALEFYLNPLKIFKINIYEIAIMISIALRFIPTLMEEMERIKKAQMSRGLDLDNGKYIDKIRGITTIIVPLFISCFDKADELTNAMIVKGYDSGKKRSKYKRFSTSKFDIITCVFIILSLTIIIVVNGVIL